MHEAQQASCSVIESECPAQCIPKQSLIQSALVLCAYYNRVCISQRFKRFIGIQIQPKIV